MLIYINTIRLYFVVCTFILNNNLATIYLLYCVHSKNKIRAKIFQYETIPNIVYSLYLHDIITPYNEINNLHKLCKVQKLNHTKLYKNDKIVSFDFNVTLRILFWLHFLVFIKFLPKLITKATH